MGNKEKEKEKEKEKKTSSDKEKEKSSKHKKSKISTADTTDAPEDAATATTPESTKEEKKYSSSKKGGKSSSSKKKSKKRSNAIVVSDGDTVSSAGSYYHNNYDSDSSSLSSRSTGSELSLPKNSKLLKGVRREASKSSLLDNASIPNGNSFRRSYLSSDEEDGGDNSSLEDDEITSISELVLSFPDDSSALENASAVSNRAPVDKDKDKTKSKEKEKGNKADKKEKRQKDISLDEYFHRSMRSKDTLSNKKTARKDSFESEEMSASASKRSSSKKENKSSKNKERNSSEGLVSDVSNSVSVCAKKIPPRKSSRKDKNKEKADNTILVVAESSKEDTESKSFLMDLIEAEKSESKNNRSLKKSQDGDIVEADGKRTSKKDKSEDSQTTKKSSKKDKVESESEDHAPASKTTTSSSSKRRDNHTEGEDDEVFEKEKVKKRNKKERSSNTGKYSSDEDSDMPKRRSRKDKSSTDHEDEVAFDWAKMSKKEKDSALDELTKNRGPSDVPPKKKSKDKKERFTSSDDHIPVLLKLSDDNDVDDMKSENAKTADEVSFGSPLRKKERLLIDIIKRESAQRQKHPDSQSDDYSIASAPSSLYAGKEPTEKYAKSPKKSPKHKKKQMKETLQPITDLPLVSAPPLEVETTDNITAMKEKKRKEVLELIKAAGAQKQKEAKAAIQDANVGTEHENIEHSQVVTEPDKETKALLTPMLKELLHEADKNVDEMMTNIMNEYPDSANIKFGLDALALHQPSAGQSCLYLLSILCTIGASRDTLSLCYDLNPSAMEEMSEWSGTPLHCAISFGVAASAKRGSSNDEIFQMLEFLMEQEPVPLQSQHNPLSRSALHQALLSLWTKPSYTYTQEAISEREGVLKSQISIVATEVVSLLLEYHHQSMAALPDSERMLPLHIAARNVAPLKVLESILKANKDACLATCKTKGYTPLHYATNAAGEAVRDIYCTNKQKRQKKEKNAPEADSQSFAPLQTHLSTIEALLKAVPLAAQVSDELTGRLPLHVLIDSSMPEDPSLDILHLPCCPPVFLSILEKLSKTFPDAANTPDNHGGTPLESAEAREACDSVIAAISLL